MTVDVSTAGPLPALSFPPAEFAGRLARAQAAMARAGIDALLLLTEPEVRWFTGFRTQFWQSPTRPWFLVVPAAGKPVAVVPEIGAALMRATWLDDVRSWSSPHADDDGVSLLAAALTDALPAAGGRIGLPMGRESCLRMPLADFHRLQRRLPAAAWVDASPVLQALRMVKTPAEIAILRAICAIGSRAFGQADSLFGAGLPLDLAFRRFRIALLQAGAEEVPYLVGGAGPDGYADVISPPDGTPLAAGDVLMLDTGAALGGYYCDFDRNWAIGRAGDAARRAYDRLYAATEAGHAAARPGARACDVHAAMAAVLGAGDSAVGRYGHGLGLQLTEPPSLIGFDETVLEPGMVITLEPSIDVVPGRVMVQEENIVIADGPADWLTDRAAPALPVIDGSGHPG